MKSSVHMLHKNTQLNEISQLLFKSFRVRMLQKEKGRETIVYFYLFFSMFSCKALYFVGLCDNADGSISSLGYLCDQ